MMYRFAPIDDGVLEFRAPAARPGGPATSPAGRVMEGARTT